MSDPRTAACTATEAALDGEQTIVQRLNEITVILQRTLIQLDKTARLTRREEGPQRDVGATGATDSILQQVCEVHSLASRCDQQSALIMANVGA